MQKSQCMTVDKRRSAKHASLLAQVINVFCKSQAGVRRSGSVNGEHFLQAGRSGEPRKNSFFLLLFVFFSVPPPTPPPPPPEYLQPTSPLGDCQRWFSGWHHEDFHGLFNFLYLKMNFLLTNSLCSHNNWWEEWVIKSLLLKMFALFTSWIDFL